MGERLTDRDVIGAFVLTGIDDGPGFGPVRGAVIDKLADYEDAEEQGRLVTLPVQIGQKVYVIMNLSVGIEPWIEETTVCAFTLRDSHYPRCVWSFSTETTESFQKSDIGKRVFLTREEAEAALQAQVAAQ